VAPAFAAIDFTDRAGVDVEPSAQSERGFGSTEAADFEHFSLGQFCRGHLLAPKASAMHNRIVNILLARFPAEMTGMHAALVALAATMCGLVAWCRRWAVAEFAHYPMCLKGAAIDGDLPAPVAVEGEWPLQAFVSRVVDMSMKPRNLRPATMLALCDGVQRHAALYLFVVAPTHAMY
jgi:hypothetical protein